jgi:hypothetical protein
MNFEVHFVDAFLDGLEFLGNHFVLLAEFSHLRKFVFLLDLVFYVGDKVVSIIDSWFFDGRSKIDENKKRD